MVTFSLVRLRAHCRIYELYERACKQRIILLRNTTIDSKCERKSVPERTRHIFTACQRRCSTVVSDVIRGASCMICFVALLVGFVVAAQ